MEILIEHSSKPRSSMTMISISGLSAAVSAVLTSTPSMVVGARLLSQFVSVTKLSARPSRSAQKSRPSRRETALVSVLRSGLA